PSPGTVWTDAYLLRALGLQIGDRLGLGEGRFNIAALLTHEPDEGRNPFAFAPRVLMNRADLAATGLMGPASRASHRLLVAGEAEAVMAYRDWVRPRLGPNISMTEALKAQNEFSLAFERAARFLHLASLSTLLVAGAAIALASQRLVQRQIDAMALMRCLGAPRHLLLWALTGRLLLLGLLASLVGGLFGWLGQLALGAVLADWFKAELPAPSPWPLTVGA
ncbi:MAG: ABC transporter permease, partial [Burkholderiales bacterium]|nr:ABC transporter permease [Burkholderiales bacterium]